MTDHLTIFVDTADKEDVMQGESGWQPIETAPRDGRLILGYGPHLRHMIMFWGRVTEYNPPAWHGGHCRVNHISQPTHWIPLPAPPAQEQSE